MPSFTGWKQTGENLLDYMMRHRPTPDLELSAGLHDLGEVFPGIYGNGAKSYAMRDPKVNEEAMRAIMAAQDNPEAMVEIYRAVPKGVRDFNPGDWVSTSKTYAKGHGQNVLKGDYDLIKTKARAADISEPWDSIAEQGYWGLPTVGQVTRGLLPLIAGGGVAAALSPDDAEAAVQPKFRPDFFTAFAKAKARLPWDDVPLGETPARALQQLKEIVPTITDPNAMIRFPHGMETRGELTREQLAQLYADAFNEDALTAIRNKPGGWRAPAAFWQQRQKQSGFFPVTEKDGHPLILSAMPMKTKDIQKYLLANGWGLGGRTVNPSIKGTLQSLGIEVPDRQQVRLSAVSSRPLQTLGDFLLKRKMLSAAIGTGAVLYPTETAGEDDHKLGGLLGRAARDGQPQEQTQKQDTGAGIKRGLSSGTRAVLEGLGGLAEMGPNAIANLAISPFTDYRFRNPGTAAADAMGLATPQTDAEKSVYGLVQGATEAVPFVGGGAALAKGAGGTARQFGKWLADSPKTQAVLGGLLGMLAGSGDE